MWGNIQIRKVSFEDFLHGVRPKIGQKAPLAERLNMPSEPESWVSEEDYYVKQIRRYLAPPPEESYIIPLRKQKKPTPPPPESDISMYQALDEVMSPTRGMELEMRLMDMAREDLREFEAGLINQDELERRRIASNIIQNNHKRRMERIADWYLDNYFRVFENPQPPEAGDDADKEEDVAANGREPHMEEGEEPALDVETVDDAIMEPGVSAAVVDGSEAAYLADMPDEMAASVEETVEPAVDNGK